MACSHGCCATSREHWLSVAVSPSATPSRAGGAEAARVGATEKRWVGDHAAYRRLRKEGFQPRLDGAAAVEARAESPVEVESGRVMDKRHSAFVEEARAVAAELRAAG